MQVVWLRAAKVDPTWQTWLLSDQMNCDIMEVAEHHLDVKEAGEEAGRIESGRVPLDLDTCQSDKMWRDQWVNDGNDQTTLEILTVFERLGGPC